MAITDVVLDQRGPLNRTPEGTEITDTWKIVTNDSSHDQGYIDQNAYSAGLPPYYSPHPTVAGVAIYDITIQPSEGSTHVWDAVLRYSSKTSDFQHTNPASWSTAPSLRPPTVQLQSVDVQQALDKAKNSTGDEVNVQTTAGEAFDPPFTKNIKNSLATITRMQTLDSFNDDIRLLYLDKVNSKVFGSKPAKSVLMRDITAKTVFENGVSYWEVTYELEYSQLEQKWEVWIPNVGYKMMNQTTDKTEEIWLDKSDDGAPIPFSEADPDDGDIQTASPWRLDSDSVPIDDPNTDTHYQKYVVKEEVDFEPLNLPT